MTNSQSPSLTLSLSRHLSVSFSARLTDACPKFSHFRLPSARVSHWQLWCGCLGFLRSRIICNGHWILPRPFFAAFRKLHFQLLFNPFLQPFSTPPLFHSLSLSLFLAVTVAVSIFIVSASAAIFVGNGCHFVFAGHVVALNCRKLSAPFAIAPSRLATPLRPPPTANSPLHQILLAIPH